MLTWPPHAWCDQCKGYIRCAMSIVRPILLYRCSFWWNPMMAPQEIPGTPLDAPSRCPRPPPIVLGEVARWSIRLTLVDVIHKLINWLVISQWLINQFITNKLMKLRLFDQLLTLRGIYVLFLEQSTIFIMSPSLIDLTLKSMKLKLFYFDSKTHQIQAVHLKFKISYPLR